MKKIKVICVEDVLCDLTTTSSTHITTFEKGKEYDWVGIDYTDSDYRMILFDGREYAIHKSKVLTIKELRKKKLEEIIDVNDKYKRNSST